MTMIGDKSKFFKNNVFSLNRCCDIVCANDSGHVISHNVAGTNHKNYKNLSELLDEMDLVLQGFVFSDGRLYGAIQDKSSAEIGYWSSKQIGGVTMISLNHLNAQSCLSAKMISIFETMDYMPGVIFIKDLCGRYIYINKYAVFISDFESSDEIIGRTDKDLWPDSAGLLSKNDCEVIESKQVKKVIEKFTRRNGQVRYYTGFKMPIIQDGKVTALIGNMVDISDVHEKVSEMTDQRDQAIRQNQSKLEFIRNMQHDIRTPFSGVVGMANLLYEREQCPEKKSMLEALVSSADELLSYCNDIIDYANIEGGQFILLERPFDLQKLVQTVYNLEKPAAMYKSLKFSLQYDSGLGRYFVGDPFRIQRILINLVGNAIKFTQQGKVIIKLKKIKEYTEKRTIIVCIQVIDTGIGIRAHDQDLIFEKMTKVSPSSQGLYRGHGFGLKIVKQFAEEIEGDLHLESSPENGTKLSVVFPLRIPLAHEDIY